MSIDMREIIGEAAKKLLFEKKVKALTVKDIVTECNITRQAFYYHFESIPELFQWMLEKDSEKLVEECMKQETIEQGIDLFFNVALSMRVYTERGLRSKYGDELERLLKRLVFELFNRAMQNSDVYKEYSLKDKEFMIKYHYHAIMGIIKDWNQEDENEKGYIVKQISLILQNEI